MFATSSDILKWADSQHVAIGGFNVYNFEGIKAVIEGAEEEETPIIIQMHPASLQRGAKPLMAMALEAANLSKVPVSIHLDHVDSLEVVKEGIDFGLQSFMPDGSIHNYQGNVEFTRLCARIIKDNEGFVEGELGRLSGTEDGTTIENYKSLLTDPLQVIDFVSSTTIDALAVCVGNVHGKYLSEPKLDFQRLYRIREATEIPLVMHGASGLPNEIISECIRAGISKFNVNTELRQAYILGMSEAVDQGMSDLISVMNLCIVKMREVVVSKIRQYSFI
ncbi:MAG: class II fructose-bisphosphate aldolase [SAR202 cluster bacterium]|jgi:tagatose 1,6-diphosphate aldolase GatY/KbaY|nr:class II fructose-bisphosphate aldolase [SAR202 cluster bacterium]|tara:strand:- start:26199 stop:27032 length:834 start_codon:yes stop_codon:yes gene_type:complete